MSNRDGRDGADGLVSNAQERSEPEQTRPVTCSRVWGGSGARTVRFVDGVFLCPACNQPTSEHAQVTTAASTDTKPERT